MKSLRETAEKIAAPTIGKVKPGVYREIVAAIQVALRERDERAAKIAEAARPTGGRMWTDEQCGAFYSLTECAKTIRSEGEP